MNPFPQLAPLLNPRSVAVVGASDRPGSAGRLVLENLRQLAYPGLACAVHPRHREVAGFACYPHLQALPSAVDMVAVLVGAGQVMPVLRSAAELGVRAAWVLASGFAEAGPEGAALQQELIDLCRECGLLLCGPNCVGLANLPDRCATYSVALSPAIRSGGVSAVVQSGAVCLGLANAGRLPFRYLVSSGNEAVLDSADYISYMASDPQTEVILAFLEGIRRPAQFAAAVRSASDAAKPVLVVKVGRSELARRTVQAHTGSLAGSDAVCDAFFRRLGVIRLDTLDELVESTTLFLACPLPEGEGVGLLSLSGGQIGLIADLGQELGVSFPPLSDGAKQALAQILPPFAPLANPLDAWGSGDMERVYPACLEVVSAEEQVHLVAVSRDTPPAVAEREVEQSLAVARAAVRARQVTGKPVLLYSNLSTGFHPKVLEALSSGPAPVPYLQGSRETLRAIQAMLAYARFRRRDPVATAGCPSPPDLAAWRDRLGPGAAPLRPDEGVRLLAAYGVPSSPQELARSAEEAVEAAERIGYPVAVKLAAVEIQHKTDVGGVRLGLPDASAVADAFHQVMASAGRCCPQVVPEGVMVQAMVRQGVEVILGLLRDPEFGPVVVFGSGGVLVELLQDSAVGLAPLSAADALAMVRQTRGARLLEGFRGRPPSDVEALVDSLVRLSQLGADLGDRLAALEVNPLIVLPRGQGVSAVDLLVEARP